MRNDKSFALYASILVAALVSVLTASVQAEFARLPSPLVFLEHVALGLLVRASYKSFGGWDWAEWSFTGAPAGGASRVRDLLASGGPTADAQG